MKNWQKLSVVILILVTVAYIKLAFFTSQEPVISSEEITTEKKEEEIQKMPKLYAYLYFVGQNASKEEVYKAVRREYASDMESSKLKFALKNLLKGPSALEKSKGVYSEIPPNTKLLSITETPSKVIINLSSDFEAGGGTDSIYKRLYQLIKTVNKNSYLPVYLQINGKQVDVIGGEGLMLNQPLNENSLD